MLDKFCEDFVDIHLMGIPKRLQSLVASMILVKLIAAGCKERSGIMAI